MKKSKICSNCSEEKEFICFKKTKNGKYGFESRCIPCLKEIKNIWRLNNKESKKLSDKKYKLKNKDAWKNWYKKNKIKKDEYNKNYILKRKKIDSVYKLSYNIRSLIQKVIRVNGFKKTSKTYEILGCTFEEFKTHIEKQFLTWMNWDNYGKYTGNFNETWQLDHNIPVSHAKTQEEIIKLNHYTNFQPMCSKKNKLKGNKLDYVRL
ncbi:MAG TPA: hypothetical protein VNX68_12790 [Nitrosopumilaceae archaeon]|jgi:hypothetical protein|nr:hypothetical protein [Nitrosopumilaceae archaeon]